MSNFGPKKCPDIGRIRPRGRVPSEGPILGQAWRPVLGPKFWPMKGPTTQGEALAAGAALAPKKWPVLGPALAAPRAQAHILGRVLPPRVPRHPGCARPRPSLARRISGVLAGPPCRLREARSAPRP